MDEEKISTKKVFFAQRRNIFCLALSRQKISLAIFNFYFHKNLSTAQTNFGKLIFSFAIEGLFKSNWIPIFMGMTETEQSRSQTRSTRITKESEQGNKSEPAYRKQPERNKS